MAVAACQVPGARGSFTSVRGLGLMFDLNRHQIFPPADSGGSISWGVAGVILEKREICDKAVYEYFLGQFLLCVLGGGKGGVDRFAMFG